MKCTYSKIVTSSIYKMLEQFLGEIPITINLISIYFPSQPYLSLSTNYRSEYITSSALGWFGVTLGVCSKNGCDGHMQLTWCHSQLSSEMLQYFLTNFKITQNCTILYIF